MKSKKHKIDLIVESNAKGHLWGRIEDKGNFMPTGQGKTLQSLIENIKDSIEDYQKHEGKGDEFWINVDLKNIEFNIKFDLQEFFDALYTIKLSEVGKRAGINESLIRQYASGNKFPSMDQVKKIELALHEIGKELSQIKLYASQKNYA